MRRGAHSRKEVAIHEKRRPFAERGGDSREKALIPGVPEISPSPLESVPQDSSTGQPLTCSSSPVLVSHSLAVLSLDAVTTLVAAGLNCTLDISPSCPSSTCVQVPVSVLRRKSRASITPRGSPAETSALCARAHGKTHVSLPRHHHGRAS